MIFARLRAGLCKPGRGRLCVSRAGALGLFMVALKEGRAMLLREAFSGFI